MKLVWCQFAITVLIERLQRPAGIGNFIGVDHTIVVAIQRADDWRRGRTMSIWPGTVKRRHFLCCESGYCREHCKCS